MQVTIISSQRYINDQIVEEKQASADYTVFVSPVFEVEGEHFRVVLDGHHSLAAAKADGVTPEFVEQDEQDNDAIALLKKGDVGGFLAAVHGGDDYYKVENGADVW